jgi:uncharacterized membrane protein
MVEFGPIQIVVLGFPDVNKLKGDMLKEIFRLSEAGIIRVVGLSAIAKDEKGNVLSAQITELSDEERTKLGAAVGALIGYGAAGMKGAEAGAREGAERVSQKEFGLSRERIMEIAQNMPNGTAAGLLLVEHLWAKNLKEIARNQEGVVLANGIISPYALVALGEELAEGAETAEDVKAKLKASRPRAAVSEAEATAEE